MFKRSCLLVVQTTAGLAQGTILLRARTHTPACSRSCVRSVGYLVSLSLPRRLQPTTLFSVKQRVALPNDRAGWRRLAVDPRCARIQVCRVNLFGPLLSYRASRICRDRGRFAVLGGTGLAVYARKAQESTEFALKPVVHNFASERGDEVLVKDVQLLGPDPLQDDDRFEAAALVSTTSKQGLHSTAVHLLCSSIRGGKLGSLQSFHRIPMDAFGPGTSHRIVPTHRLPGHFLVIQDGQLVLLSASSAHVVPLEAKDPVQAWQSCGVESTPVFAVTGNGEAFLLDAVGSTSLSVVKVAQLRCHCTATALIDMAGDGRIRLVIAGDSGDGVVCDLDVDASSLDTLYRIPCWSPILAACTVTATDTEPEKVG